VDAPIASVFHIVHHWRRATDAQRWAMNPTTTNPPQVEPAPVCSGVSIAWPLLGGVLGYAVVVGKPPGDAGWPNVIFGPLVLPACAVCGLVLSAFGFARREKYPFVSALAVPVNIALLVYGIARLRS
jgi:uncharacterized membrane protein YdcZ (DUF606 family)